MDTRELASIVQGTCILASPPCLTESPTSLLCSSEEATPEEATPEAPLLAGSTAKSSKSSKTHKAHKAKSVKSWKSKGAKAEADERTAEIDGMLAWWEGSGVAFNKDGSSQSAIALENGSSRSRSLRIGAAVAFIFGALACL